MDKTAKIDGTTYADNEVLPSDSLDVAFSQKDEYHVPINMKVIFMCSIVASVGKYAFRKQNPYLFIDYSIENGNASVEGSVTR